ncbi:MAG: AAA-like domain-containing protein, partial [Blastocatellia bacterium]
MYNARATTPEFKRLSFVLIGVATPGDLIRDPQRTPFNIGQRVDLNDFAFAEALPLANGFKLPPDEAKQVLSWVMKWTSGHPYLTQRLCIALSEQNHNHWAEADVDRVVADTFFGARSEQDNNLQFVRDMLTKRAPDVESVLTTYQEIRSGKHPVRDEEQSLVKSHLKLSGVVRREQAGLRMRNPIYAAVFDERWIKQHLRVDLVKRVKRASVKLAPYVAAVLLFLSLYAGWTVRTLSAKADYAESRIKEAEAATQSAEAALEQAREETAQLNQEAKTAKDEAETAKDEAETAKKDAERVRKEAETQVQQAIATANARLQEAETKARNAEAEARKLEELAASARAGADEAKHQLKVANDAKADAEAAKAKAEVLAVQAEGQAKEAEGRLKAANEAIERTNKLQRAQDEKAKKEGFAKAVLRFHTGPVTSVAINPQNSRLIVTASEDGTARVVDVKEEVEEKRVKHTLQSQSAMSSAVFSSDGQSVVTASADGKIRISTGKEQTDL